MVDIKSIKSAIFDMDGTIMDSMWMWMNIEMDYLLSLGLQPRDDFMNIVYASNQAEIARFYQDEYGIRKTFEEIAAGKDRLIEEFYFNRATLKDGAISVLEALKSSGIRMCLATATDRYLVEPALRRCGVYGYFERIFTCGEEETNKSMPDIFLRAAAFLGTEVEETLVVEDALYAIRSAKRAGFPVAAVYDATADRHQEAIKQLCDFYLPTIDKLLDFM